MSGVCAHCGAPGQRWARAVRLCHTCYLRHIDDADTKEAERIAALRDDARIDEAQARREEGYL